MKIEKTVYPEQPIKDYQAWKLYIKQENNAIRYAKDKV